MKRVWTICLAACLLVPAARSGAQTDVDAGAAAPIDNLEQSLFISELSKRGFPELLERLVEVSPPESELEQLQIAIATDRLLYRQNQELAREIAERDTSPQSQARAIELNQEAAAAFSRMLENLQILGTQYAQEDLRPMWQTDYGETLLTTYLSTVHRNAADFYQFGVTSAQQDQAFAQAAEDALTALSDADLGFAERQSTLPREDDHVARRVNTGLWEQMMEDYWGQLTQYYLARAAYFTALLPNSAAYFQQLSRGGSEKILDQAANPQQERQRLLRLAIERGQQFLDAGGENRPDARRMTQTLQGLAHLELGQYSQANQLFDEVLEADAPRSYTLWAALGKARTLAAQGQVQQAVAEVRKLEQTQLVKQSPLNRLLVADAEHRILMTEADKQQGAARQRQVAAAYDPYIRLFSEAENDPTLGALRMLVYDRWAQDAQGRSLTSLPAAVRFGIAESQMTEAQNMYVQGQENQDTALLDEARPSLREAIAVYDTLTGADVPANIKAPAMRQKGMAHYMLAQIAPDGKDALRELLAATDTWVSLADQLPDQPQALTAIANASRILTFYHAREPRPDALDTAYPAMARVLFSKFDDSQPANDGRLYYAQVLLRDQGKWNETADVLARMPQTHGDYFAAQRERMDALIEIVDRADENRKSQEAAQAFEIIETIRPAAREEVETGGDRAEDAREALMTSILAEAEIAYMLGQIDRALTAVDGFENDFAGQDAYVPQALQIRIRALADKAQLDQLLAEAREMMNRFPDQGASVISSVLDQIEVQIDELNQQARAEQVQIRKDELLRQAEAIGQPASELADMLYAWAQDRGYSGAELIPFQLILIKANRMAGENNQALRIAKQLMADARANEANQAENDPQVLTQYGETLILSQDPADLREAQGVFYKLITAYQQQKNDYYWNSWVQWLTAAEKLGQTQDIARSVQRLQLSSPDLGGPPYREALERLAERNPG